MTILYRSALTCMERTDCDVPKCTNPAKFQWQEGAIEASICSNHDLYMQHESMQHGELVLNIRPDIGSRQT